MTTSQPSNASERQLYNVLKRANLLQYYDTFIAQGGDDVQQLCEAGEDEFLEIMALVGMAAKPLHVRRLQKALQEWVANPAALEASGDYNRRGKLPPTRPAPGSITAVVRDAVSIQVHSTQTTPSVVTAHTWTPQAASRSTSPADSVHSPSSGSPLDVKEDRSGSPMLQPVLLENQILAISTAAGALIKRLPPFEPKELNPKKQINREIQILVTSASESIPNKIEELRKYAAIYGRFDSKRKNDRPMSLHEISVNEAAAQLCFHCPTLLTRREDLFPLARQVVRDSGYQYSKGHSRAAEVVLSAKKGRLDPIFQRHFDTNFRGIKQEFDKDGTAEERMSAVAQELAAIRQHQEQVKAELVTATEEQDVQQTQKLQSELASLTSQQLQVLQEHTDLLGTPRTKFSRSKQSNGDDNGRADTSGTSSPVSDRENLASLASATFDSIYAAIRSNKGTLFDEGLRIAQQYGMNDFAFELQQLQSQRQGEGTENGGENVAKVLEQPFELKEVKPGFDSGIGDDSLDGEVIGATEITSSKGANCEGSVQSVKRSVENGVQTVDAGTLVNNTQFKGDDKPDLKRKGDNLDLLPTRPPSRRSRSSQSGGVV